MASSVDAREFNIYALPTFKLNIKLSWHLKSGYFTRIALNDFLIGDLFSIKDISKWFLGIVH